LKVFICKKLDLPQIPRAYEIHDLDALLVISGLKRRIEDPRFAKVFENWNFIKGHASHITDLRYQPARNWKKPQAMKALKCLNNPSNGVIPWLSVVS
jgi:hypothetical protein